MLSADIKAIELLKRTYPLVKDHQLAIGNQTYINMFKAHPELKELFANTRPGQGQRLISAILFYCEEPDNYELFYDRLDAIAQIHIKCGVENKYYEFMKEAFIESLQSILKDDATPELLAAWSYGFDSLSNELIHVENLIRKFHTKH